MSNSHSVSVEAQNVSTQFDNVQKEEQDKSPTDSQSPSTQQDAINIKLSEKEQQRLFWADRILKARKLGDKNVQSQLLKDAAHDLKLHETTVRKIVSAVAARGRAGVMRSDRSDRGEHRYVSETWRDLVLTLYKRGQDYSRRINRNQIWALIQAVSRKLEKVKDAEHELVDACIQGIAQQLQVDKQSHTASINQILKRIKKEIKSGQFAPPRSHRFVYKVIDAYLKEKNRKTHHNSQSLPRRIRVRDGETVIEIIVDESNKLYEIDDTPSDTLLIDAEGNIIGSPILAIVVEDCSGCVAGYHIGFTEPGAFEMGLALRHAILPKDCGLNKTGGDASLKRLRSKGEICSLTHLK